MAILTDGHIASQDALTLEGLIKQAIGCYIIEDVRSELRTIGKWPKRRILTDILGVCIHQNGSPNSTNYVATANYHTSTENHISSKPMASTVYDFMIPDIPGRQALLTADILDYKYPQGSKKHPGDENRHLISILVMGGFAGPGYKGYQDEPSPHQLRNLDRLVDWLQHTFNFDDSGLFTHSHFGKAACPGFWSAPWINLRKCYTSPTELEEPKEWQDALLTWNSKALPKYGADGNWGAESKYWLSRFQEAMGVKATGFQDDFTGLLLSRETRK